jgi:hypothetical protein
MVKINMNGRLHLEEVLKVDDDIKMDYKPLGLESVCAELISLKVL